MQLLDRPVHLTNSSSWFYPQTFIPPKHYLCLQQYTLIIMMNKRNPKRNTKYFVLLTKKIQENLLLGSSVQFSRSVVPNSATPWTAACQSSPSIINSQSLNSNSCPLCWWCHSTISSSVVLSSPAFNLSQHQDLLKCVSSLHQVAKYWNFSFSISPSNEYSGLISFRMDWLDLLEVQGTLKSLLQYHSSKASILQRSASFIVQLSHPCMTSEKTIALTRWTLD